MGIGDIFEDLRHAVVEIVSKHRLHHPFFLDSRFASGSSATCCSSCTTPALASSTLSQTCTRAFFEPIKFSDILRRQQSDAREDLHFEIYDTNWKSAEEDPDTVTHLLQEGIEFHGDIAQDEKRWRKVSAVGRFIVSRTESRDPRLCLDSTIANVNAKAQIQEKSFNSWLEDITSARVVSHPSEGVGLTIDVGKAHKKAPHPRGRLGTSTVPAPGQAPPPHGVPLRGKIQRRLMEPHWSSTYPSIPPLPRSFSTVGGSTFTIFSFGRRRQERRYWRRASVASCTSWGVPSVWHKVALGRRVNWIGLNVKFPHASGKSRKRTGTKPSMSSAKCTDKGRTLNKCGFQIPCLPCVPGCLIFSGPGETHCKKPPGSCWWFQLEGCMADLPQSWLAGNEAQPFISCFELLAQLALLVCRLRSPLLVSGRISLRQGSDNVTPGAAIVRGFTTSHPLRRFVQVIIRWATTTRVKLEVDFFPGIDNEWADALSRNKGFISASNCG